MSWRTMAQVLVIIGSPRKMGNSYKIVKRIEEAGETAAATFGDLSTGAIDGARFAFLDLDGNAEHAAPDILMPAVNVQRVADLFAEIDQPAPSPEKVTV